MLKLISGLLYRRSLGARVNVLQAGSSAARAHSRATLIRRSFRVYILYYQYNFAKLRNYLEIHNDWPKNFLCLRTYFCTPLFNIMKLRNLCVPKADTRHPRRLLCSDGDNLIAIYSEIVICRLSRQLCRAGSCPLWPRAVRRLRWRRSLQSRPCRTC